MNISKVISDNIVKKEGLITTAVVMLTCLVLVLSFPAENYFQVVAVNVIFLIALPMLYIKIILKRKISEFGWRVGDSSKGFFWMSVGLALFALVIYLFIMFTDIESDYREMIFIKRSFYLFSAYYLSTSISLVMKEFFFRGFVMNYFANSFSKKYLAIFFQAVVFFVFILISNKLNINWNVVFQALAALFAGIIAYKSRSMLYSYLFFLITMVALGVVIMKIDY
ncbi:type II CAAX prenyl endopeptidase Rce1 family protein [Patescibacteria group bacterium]